MWSNNALSRAFYRNRTICRSCYMDRPELEKLAPLSQLLSKSFAPRTKYVLVCAMSNSACDEIAERLAKILEQHEVYRVFARGFKHGNVSEAVRKISNWRPNQIRTPSLKRLYEYRVLCTTLCSAGCLSRSHIDRKVWRADHFGYVFIDECASSSETMTWIPIAGKISVNLFSFWLF